MALLLLMSFSGVSFAGGSNVTGGGDYRETKIREAKQLIITALKSVSVEILTNHDIAPEIVGLYQQQGLAIAQDLEGSNLNFFFQEEDRKTFIIEGEEKTFKTIHQPQSTIDANLPRAEELKLTLEGSAALLTREGARHLNIQDNSQLAKIEEMAFSILGVYHKIQIGVKPDSELKAELISQMRSFFDLLPKATPQEADTASFVKKLKDLQASRDYQTCIAPGFWTKRSTIKSACLRIIDTIENMPIIFRKTITDKVDPRSRFSEQQAHFQRWFETLTEFSHQLYALLSLHWATEQYNTLHLTKLMGAYNGDLLTAAAGKKGEPDYPLDYIAKKLVTQMLIAFETDFPKMLEENQKTISTLFTQFCNNTQKSGFDFSFFNSLPPLTEDSFRSMRVEFLQKLHSFETVLNTWLNINLSSYVVEVERLKNSDSYKICTEPSFWTTESTMNSHCNSIVSQINSLYDRFRTEFGELQRKLQEKDRPFTTYVNALHSTPPLPHDIAVISKTALTLKITKHQTELIEKMNALFMDVHQRYQVEHQKNFSASVKWLVDQQIDLFKNHYPSLLAEARKIMIDDEPTILEKTLKSL